MARHKVWAISHIGTTAEPNSGIRRVGICAEKKVAEVLRGWGRSHQLDALPDGDPGAIFARAHPGKIVALVPRQSPEINSSTAVAEMAKEIGRFEHGEQSPQDLRRAVSEVLDRFLGAGHHWIVVDQQLADRANLWHAFRRVMKPGPAKEQR